MSENQEPNKKLIKEEDSEEELPLTGVPSDQDSERLKPVPSAEITRLRDKAISPSGPNYPASQGNINKECDQKKN
ncbi:unnamed protein product [Bursaphelenchus xylophilus]|uniref:(pine wood nematode) hypothetical protein n=1 Tax=Bursaphelenchus xylophilus TaxID=6326 RepID=A0A1I7SCK9_BURXY|nr:unnamed protein product [Bursaphelenchus xylophilus]CAG9093921.1 unnamed protein product [Bursaphelenchus xylophilus]